MNLTVRLAGATGNRMSILTARNKFSAERQTVDGISFASRKEAAKYIELSLLKKAGKIRDFECQPVIEMPVGKYTPDFRIVHLDGTSELWEVKGVRTEAFQLRLRCFHYFHPSLRLTINGVDSKAKRARRARRKKL